jgi:hypothetical protein
MECEEIGTAPHNGQQHRAGSGAAGTGQNVMIGESDALKRVWFCVEQAAPIDATVLIAEKTFQTTKLDELAREHKCGSLSKQNGASRVQKALP